MQVALICNDFRREEAAAVDSPGLHQIETTLEAVRKVLRAAGHKVQEIILPPEPNLALLHNCDAEVAFNLTTGILNKRMQLYAVALMEMAGLNFIGSDLRTQVVCLDKSITKALLREGGITTPRYQVIRCRHDSKVVDQDLLFPVIVKPCMEGSSLGITSDSVVYDRGSLHRRVKQLQWEFGGDVIVEQFLPGREFTVGIIGNEDARTLPVQEIVYSDWPEDAPPIYSFEAKVEERTLRECPAEIDDDVATQIEGMALAAFRLLGMTDIARFDIRLDAQGVPHVLEVNALPGLQPGYSEYPRMAEVGGLSYEDLIDSLVRCCAARADLIGAQGDVPGDH